MLFCRSPRVLRLGGVLALVIVAATTVGCFSNSRRDDSRIRITGSDTMVNLAQAWAEAYQKNHPDISAQVRGGGSGVGIAALINGKVDIAPASRAMTEEELKLAKEKTGKDPKQYIVGRDALAIYIHKDNPLETITIDQLGDIYGEGGGITKWKQLDVDNQACSGGEIIRISRQNNSGTYVYFREAVLGGNRQYKQGTLAQSGSSDVVALVSNTPCAIGYSGMGYYQPGAVKMVKVSPAAGKPGVAPSVESALDGSYPIARPLYIYTLGEPTGALQEFIQWVLGPEGQKIVAEVGYVPNGGSPTAEEEQPEAKQPAAKKSESGKTDAEKPETDAPKSNAAAPDKSESDKSKSDESESDKSDASDKEPAASEPEGSEPEPAPEPAAKESAPEPSPSSP